MAKIRSWGAIALIITCAFFSSGCMALLQTAVSAAVGYGLYKATK